MSIRADAARERTIRVWLGYLVLACTLPAWLVIVAITVRGYQSERAGLEQDTVATARALMQAVDRELAGVQAALQALATSPSLQSGDFAALYRQAARLLEGQTGANIVLAAPDGQQIINTLRPFGAPLPVDPTQLEPVFKHRRPIVSDIFMGPVAGRLIVAVAVPVFVDGNVVYALAIGLLPERLAEILARQGLPADWVVAIFDTDGTVVARNRDPERFVGKPGAPLLVQHLARMPEGVIETDTLEGIPVVSSFSRSGLSGWAVAIGIPQAALLADLRRSLWLSVGAAGAALILGALMARRISLRVIRSLHDLAVPALQLGAGAKPYFPTGEVAEVNDLARALTKASDLIEERAAERDLAAARQRDAAEALRASQAELLHVSRVQAVGQMAASLAHELNQPLSAAVNYMGAGRHILESARGEGAGAGAAQAASHIEKAAAQIVRAGAIVRRIRSFISGDDGQRHPEDLDVLVQEAAGLALVGAKQKNVDLKLELAGEALTVLVDRIQIQQVVFNLLRNAIEAMESAPRRQLTVRTRRVDRQFARVEVADTGPGLDPEIAGKIFQPFNSTKAGGMGLGLSICRTIVVSHGGAMDVESRPGAGATFWFTVPLATE